MTRCAVVALLALAGCSGPPAPPPAPPAAPTVGDQSFPPWMLGLWSREWVQRGGQTSSTFTVRYLQTPSLFGDVRIPLDRPRWPAARSFADLTDADLRQLARQRGFLGRLTVDTMIARWDHEIDFQPNDGGQDIARIERAGPFRMMEVALDGSYAEHWWSLGSGDGRFLAIRIERAGRLDRILLVAGDHFIYGRNRTSDLPPGPSLDSLIAANHPTREQLIAWLDCELSVGRIRGGRVPWEIEFSTLPWRQAAGLDFVERITVPDSIGGLRPTAGADETWTVPVNTFAPADLALLFPTRR